MEEALAQALLLLAKDKHLRQQMGAKGRNKTEKYKWKNVAKKWSLIMPACTEAY